MLALDLFSSTTLSMYNMCTHRILTKQLRNCLFTARVRSTTGCYIFSLFVSLMGGGRWYPTHWSLVSGPRSFPGGGEGVSGGPVPSPPHPLQPGPGGGISTLPIPAPPARTRTGCPPTNPPGQDQDRVPPPHPTLLLPTHPQSGNVTDRIQLGRYASCVFTGLSFFQILCMSEDVFLYERQ